MRVIAGTQKGRRLKAPAGNRVRPTSDRVREALFSILDSRVREAKVLDLCCGTGTVGLEAISRGAAQVFFVDDHADSLQLLRENLKRCGNPPGATVFSHDAWQVARHIQFLHYAPFDIMYVDPPYQLQRIERLIESLATEQIVAQNGVMIVEHFRKTGLPLEVGCLEQVRQAQYGDTMLTFFQQPLHSHENRRLPGNL